MAGGVWTAQNKILPGYYLNVRAAAPSTLNYGVSGVAAICEPMSWGPVATPITIDSNTDVFQTLGYDLGTSEKMLFLRELFLGATTPDGTPRVSGAASVLLYRPAAAGAAQAKATMGNLTATAKYPGIRGNDITITISADADNDGYFFVETSVGGAVQDSQHVNAIASLTANGWVTFTGTGALAAAVATALTGGLDGTVAASAYASFLTVVEPLAFNVLIYDGTDSTVAASFVTFVNRLRDEQGLKIRLVTSGSESADNEAITSIANGMKLSNGTTLTAAQCCWWIGGCSAGATYYQSLTYAVHPGAVDVSPKYTLTQMKENVKAGKLTFFEDDGTVRILEDINTLTTFTATKNDAFSRNRVMRVLDYIANSLYRAFADYNIGQTDNNSSGRDLVKKEVVGLLKTMQANNGVQNFSNADVTVLPGEASNAITIDLAVQPVDAVEKIYMTMTVN
ncbi:phage tail sheath family protein [Oscillibacter ruminantium]|nr:phage tail sheath family protein [Oscillibacter valericigenes]